MLRESFGLDREADAIVHALRSLWREGYRTQDVAVRGSRVVGTSELAGPDRAASRSFTPPGTPGGMTPIPRTSADAETDKRCLFRFFRPLASEEGT